jgi:hypothetical protein
MKSNSTLIRPQGWFDLGLIVNGCVYRHLLPTKVGESYQNSALKMRSFMCTTIYCLNAL